MKRSVQKQDATDDIATEDIDISGGLEFHSICAETEYNNYYLEHAPNDAHVQVCKSMVLDDLERYEEALAAYEKAIQLDPNYFTALKGIDNALYKLKRYREALAAYNRDIQLNPKDADVYNRKGDVTTQFAPPSQVSLPDTFGTRATAKVHALPVIDPGEPVHP